MKVVPFYIDSPENSIPGGFTLYFADGVKDLPYVELTDWIGMINELNADYHIDMAVNEEDGLVTLMRENESFMTVDFVSGSVVWNDYCAFIQEATVLIRIWPAFLPRTGTDSRTCWPLPPSARNTALSPASVSATTVFP